MTAAVHITTEQADEYALGALEPEIAGLVRLHIEECLACEALVAQSERVTAALALGVPLHPPPARLRRRVFRSAGLLGPRPLRLLTRVVAAGAGAAAIFIAVAAFTGMVSVRGQVSSLRAQNDNLQAQIDDALSQKVEIAALTQRLTEEERTSWELRRSAGGDRDLLLALLSPQSDVAEVFAVDESSRSIGRLVWDPDQKKVWFVANQLPALGPGQTYQLWVNAGGKYLSLGAFNSDATGFARYETFVPQGLQTYEAALVTIERPGSSERNGPSVFVTDLSRLRR